MEVCDLIPPVTSVFLTVSFSVCSKVITLTAWRSCTVSVSLHAAQTAGEGGEVAEWARSPSGCFGVSVTQLYLNTISLLFMYENHS